MRFTIVKKIAFSMILLVLLLLAAILFSIHVFQDGDRLSNTLRIENIMENSAYELETNISSLIISVNELILTKDQKYYESINILNDKINQNVKLLESLPLDTKERKILVDIKNYLDSIHYTDSVIFRSIEPVTNANTVILIDKIDSKFREKIQNDVSLFQNHIHKSAESVYNKFHKEKEHAAFTFLLLSIAAFLVSVGVVIFSVKHISKPILKLVKAAEKIAIRDFSVKLKNESKDEIGMLIIAFNSMINEINRRYEDLENFSHIVAHDLKSPLNGVIGMAEILITDYGDKLDEEGHEFVENIIWSGRQMAALINDLLEFATAGKITISENPVSMNDILDDIKTELNYEIKQKNVTLTIQPGLPKIKCDPLKLGQVWKNLISNSIKYNDKPVPVVEIGLLNDNDIYNYCFFVKDNGIGIKKEYIDDIFSPFHRAPTKKKYEGTGIGLSIVKRIIDFHNGKIWAESQLGNGTTFFITMPKQKI